MNSAPTAKERKFSSSPLCLISALAWGISFPMQEIASGYSDLLSSFAFNGLRMLLAGFALIPVVFLFERHADYSRQRIKATALRGALAGAILFSASSFQQFGIQLTKESGKAGFITSLYLVIVAVISFVIFKERLSPFVVIAMPISLTGLYFLSFSEGFSGVQAGDLLVLVCAFLYATHIIVLDKSANATNPLLFSCVQFFVAGILGTAFGGIFGTVTAEGIKGCALPILFCGIFSVAVAYTLQLLGQRNGNPTVCALFCSMESLFAVIAECVMEAKLPSAKMIIGCGLMLTAVVLAQLPRELFKRKIK